MELRQLQGRRGPIHSNTYKHSQSDGDEVLSHKGAEDKYGVTTGKYKHFTAVLRWSFRRLSLTTYSQILLPMI